MSTNKGFKAAHVVRDAKTAMLMVDPMRRTILNLLADKSLTESQLAIALGLTAASVGHHLKILSRAKLIKIERREEEAHGIMQNFYRSVARCVVVDTERMPKQVAKYFFPINMERIRGALAANGNGQELTRTSSAKLEEIAEKMAAEIANEAEKLEGKKTKADRETTTIEIYRKALARTLKHLKERASS